MKIRKRTILWAAASIAIVLALGFGLVNRQKDPISDNGILDLKKPSFVGIAMADTGSFLDDEAGIAAYTQTPSSINLSTVRDAFRTIERETDQYIIGSVDIPGYSEDHSPHVYIHTDGWVLAYYYNTEPASYILDLRHYDGVDIGSTKLEDAIYEILSVIGVVNFDVEFYDFRYPTATNIMLVAEANYEGGNESFDIHLPSDFTYFDRSWSHAINNSYNRYTDLYLDNNLVNTLDFFDAGWYFAHGSFTTVELSPGVSHTMKIYLSYESSDAFCGMALVYQEVP